VQKEIKSSKLATFFACPVSDVDAIGFILTENKERDLILQVFFEKSLQEDLMLGKLIYGNCLCTAFYGYMIDTSRKD